MTVVSPPRDAARLPELLQQVRACTACGPHFPHAPRPVLQADQRARILIAAQAPGRKVHASGVPFDDASGARLRDWLGLARETFYDPATIAIAPMSFCFPGTANGADLPPRPECAARWRRPLLALLPGIELTLVIGAYALRWHLPEAPRSVTAVMRAWRQRWPQTVPLPHPSPRNNRWLKANPWFEQDVLPALRVRVQDILNPV